MQKKKNPLNVYLKSRERRSAMLSFTLCWQQLGLDKAEGNSPSLEFNLGVSCRWWKLNFLNHHLLLPGINPSFYWSQELDTEPQYSDIRGRHPNDSAKCLILAFTFQYLLKRVWLINMMCWFMVISIYPSVLTLHSLWNIQQSLISQVWLFVFAVHFGLFSIEKVCFL